jgi:translation initiation factor 3 subunit H
MMRCLREVNVDNNTVGWYQTVTLSSFFNLTTIETQFSYQEAISTSVFIVYDANLSFYNGIHLRAYRLSDKFMKAFKSGSFILKAIQENGVTPESIFEEVPVVIKNSALTKAFLSQVDLSLNVESIDKSFFPFMHRNISGLTESMDDYMSAFNRIYNYQKSIVKQQQALKKKVNIPM